MFREIVALIQFEFLILVLLIICWIFNFESISGILGLLFFASPFIYLFYKIAAVLLEDRRKSKEYEIFLKKKNYFLRILEEYIPTLYNKKQLAIKKDDYGLIDIKWWNKEKREFLDKLKTKHNLYLSNEYYLDLIDQKVDEYDEPEYDDSDEVPTDPYEYEQYCARILNDNGWSAKATKGSGDHGVDIIARINGKNIAIQCKLYNSSVGNTAVQEVVTGMKYWNCSIPVVVTNSNYTKHAVDIARTHNVYLLHHDDLDDLNFIIRKPPIYIN